MLKVDSSSFESAAAVDSHPKSDIETEFFAALSAGDTARAAHALADHVLFLYPGLPPVHGRGAVARYLRHLRSRFADLTWTRAASLEVGPEWRITTWTVAGSRRAGGGVRAEAASLIRLDRDGRIAYLSDYFKSRDTGRPADTRSLDVDRPLRSF